MGVYTFGSSGLATVGHLGPQFFMVSLLKRGGVCVMDVVGKE